MILDLHKARYQRYAWVLLLTLLARQSRREQQTIRAIAQWVHLNADTLWVALRGQPLPNEATILRTIHRSMWASSKPRPRPI